MSGPKDYIAEPEYTKDAFAGELSNLQKSQSKLLLLLREVCAIDFRDEAMGIHINGANAIANLKEQILSICDPLVFDLEDSFRQDVYDRISNEIQQHQLNVNGLMQAGKNILNDLECKAEDYKSFMAYRLHVLSTEKALKEYKKVVLEKYTSNFYEQHAPNLILSATNEFNEIVINFKIQTFQLGFRNQKQPLIDSLMKEVKAIEVQIESKRSIFNQQAISILSKLPNHLFDTGIIQSSASQENSEDLKEIQQKIEYQIGLCVDPEIRMKWAKQFSDLKESKSLQMLHFYAQIHDEIIEDRKKSICKTNTLKILRTISRIKVEGVLLEDKKLIVAHCNAILNDKVHISEETVKSLEEAVRHLKDRNNENQLKETKRKNELLFLKAQVIHSMENMGYEVLDNLELIDLEKQNNFYLKTTDEKNIINLKFDEYGQLRYFFQIPEEKELSTDEERKKLAEMQVSCDDFKKMMGQLRNLGLNIKIKDEKPVDAKFISRTPNEYRKQSSNSKEKKQKTALKRRYLKD